MAIALTTQPVTANAALTETDVKSVLTALSEVVTLPSGEDVANIVALNVTIQPNGSGVLNVRFSK